MSKKNSIEDIEELKRLLYRDELTQYGKRKLINYYEQQEKDYKRILKENEELNYKLHSKKIALEIYNRYIPVQKVKDKVEKLEEQYKTALEENSTKAFILKCQITILQELLEKEQ